MVIDFNCEVVDVVVMGDYEQFCFEGYVGEEVYGYLVKLYDYIDGVCYLIVFLVYGGLQGFFGNNFYYWWNLQVYVGVGYVVVMIDFYGLVGYGQVFIDLIQGDWGGKLFEDFKKGFVYVFFCYLFFDGICVCVFGVFYGGYMMNWIVGLWFSVFCCLVNYDGVFDLCLMYYMIEEFWFLECEFGGFYFFILESFEKYNLVNFIENFCMLMLIIQGGCDYCVLEGQLFVLFIVLQCQEVLFWFLYFLDENYWVFKLNNLKQWYCEVFVWFEWWMN